MLSLLELLELRFSWNVSNGVEAGLKKSFFSKFDNYLRKPLEKIFFD
jgi:hypothetical protein